MKFFAILWILCLELKVISSQDRKPNRPSYQTFQKQKEQNSEQSNLNASGSCHDIFSYHSYEEGFYGVVTIAKPDLQKSILRVFLSLAALLPSVRSNAKSECKRPRICNQKAFTFLKIENSETIDFD